MGPMLPPTPVLPAGCRGSVPGLPGPVLLPSPDSSVYPASYDWSAGDAASAAQQGDAPHE